MGDLKYIKNSLSKVWSVVLVICSFTMIAAYQNCGQQKQAAMGVNSEPTTFTATVSKSSLDGCQYVLTSVDQANGDVQSYVPANLPANLLVDGTTLTVTGNVAPDIVDTCVMPVFEVQHAELAGP